MRAEELRDRCGMAPHIENGAFIERHYEHTGEGRAASGSIYYYVGADERTEFHVIDCDEYWCYSLGATLEVWLADGSGVRVERLGVEPGAEPLIYVPKGTSFASKHAAGTVEGTFLTCITVPRFSPAGFTLQSRGEICELYPQCAAFWED